MTRGEWDSSVDAPETTQTEDGAAVAAGACRDLVAGDRYGGAWVGVRDGDELVGVAAAGDGDDQLSAETTSLETASPLAAAVESDEIRVGSATVAVPFSEGVLGVSLSANDTVEEAEDLPVGERHALTATARTLGRLDGLSASGETTGIESAVDEETTARESATDDDSATTDRFREAFDRHDAVMLLIDPDDGTIRDANDAAVSFYGYPEQELLGKPIQSINTASPAEVARERSRAEEHERNYFVFDHELASGERRTVEVHSTPVPLPDGPVLFSVIHDVTERTEYEAELQRYGELFENIPVGLFRTRPGSDGVFEEVNPALVKLFGAESKRELVGRRPSDLYRDSDDRDVFSEQLLEAGVLEEWEHELQRLDGEPFWASISAIRTETSDGPVFDGIVQDVSDQKAYQKSLEERNERMEVLNQLLRHDIRNDMAVIGGTLDLLAEHLDDEGRARLDTLQSRVDHVVELTHTARNITETLSVESEETMETEPIRLDQVLADELENARSSFPDATFSLATEVPAVSVAATKLLDSVFRNLLNNAVQHNDGESPAVEVDVTVDTETVTVAVADDGPGVPDGQKASIFERGEKGEASSGTGLGLYLVGALVDQYDGEITVADNDPEGAVFRVTLQRADGGGEGDGSGDGGDGDEQADIFGGVAE